MSSMSAGSGTCSGGWNGDGCAGGAGPCGGSWANAGGGGGGPCARGPPRCHPASPAPALWRHVAPLLWLTSGAVRSTHSAISSGGLHLCCSMCCERRRRSSSKSSTVKSWTARLAWRVQISLVQVLEGHKRRARAAGAVGGAAMGAVPKHIASSGFEANEWLRFGVYVRSRAQKMQEMLT